MLIKSKIYDEKSKREKENQHRNINSMIEELKLVEVRLTLENRRNHDKDPGIPGPGGIRGKSASKIHFGRKIGRLLKNQPTRSPIPKVLPEFQGRGQKEGQQIHFQAHPTPFS